MKSPLGGSHETYAAPMLTLSAAAVFFMMARNHQVEHGWWLLGFVIAVVSTVFAVVYCMRAHGVYRTLASTSTSEGSGHWWNRWRWLGKPWSRAGYNPDRQRSLHEPVRSVLAHGSPCGPASA